MSTAVTDRDAHAPVQYVSLSAANYGLALLFTAYVLSYIDRQILSLLVGPIRESFGITDFQYSLLMGPSFAIVYAVMGLPLGRLADRYSRRIIVSGAVMFWSLATSLGGLAQNFYHLFASRMGVGAGEAGLSPAAYSLIADSYRPKHFGFAISVYKSAVKIGAGVALLVGGPLYDFYAGFDVIIFPLLGEIEPWQATLVTVGMPGVLLSLLLLTMREPTRKGVLADMEARGQSHFPLRTVLAFLWQRKRMYVSLFLGASMMAVAGYGNTAWYPEFLSRSYGMSKTEIGTYYGLTVIVAGSIGVFVGAWMANWLHNRGRVDAYVRTIMYASLLALAPAVFAPLMGSPLPTFVLLFPALILGNAYLGVMAASFSLITPNRIRGQATAIYIFCTSMLGMAAGIVLTATFTDFVFKDDDALHLSISSVNALCYPIAAFLCWYCLPAYRAIAAEAKRGWNI